jgi:hypothetical protein
MTTIRFISGAAALSDFIAGIHGDVDDRLDQRGINASGAMKRSNRTDVVPGIESMSANLYALGYWKTAGSGSPPGTKVSGDALMKWAMDKGLAIDERRAARIAIYTQRKIFKEGSKQHRENGENVYQGAVEAAAPKIPELIRAFLSDYREPIATEFKRAFA